MKIIIDVKNDNKDTITLEANTLSDPHLRKILYNYVKSDISGEELEDVELRKEYYLKYATSTRVVYEHLVKSLKDFYIDKILKYPSEEKYVVQIIAIETISEFIMNGYKVDDKKKIVDFMITAFNDNRHHYYKIKDLMKKEFHLNIDDYEKLKEDEYKEAKDYICKKIKSEFNQIYTKVIEKYTSLRESGVDIVNIPDDLFNFKYSLENSRLFSKNEDIFKFENDLDYLIRMGEGLLKVVNEYKDILSDYDKTVHSLKILFDIKEDN